MENNKNRNRNREEKEIRRGDIFYIDIPKDIMNPHKQCKLRPCLIVSNDSNNKYSTVIQYVPITTKLTKAKLPTHIPIRYTQMERNSIAMCEGVTTADKMFIRDKVGHMSSKDMKNIEIGLRIQFTIDFPPRPTFRAAIA